MSHPNPYLFQINRAVEQSYRRMDIQQGPFVPAAERLQGSKDVFIYIFG